jgi:hypothetical protein
MFFVMGSRWARGRSIYICDDVPSDKSEHCTVCCVDGGRAQRLYELGARRVVVTGTGMIGCVPAELAMHSVDGECARDLTEAADLFNPQLVQMLSELNADIGADVFIAANTNRVSFDFMFNPQDYGTYVRARCVSSASCTYVFVNDIQTTLTKPCLCRVRDVQGGVLRAGPLQRDRAMHAGVQRVPQPGRVRVLGRVPPHGARQPDHRRPVHARIHRPHQPHEHQHHPRHGQQELGPARGVPRPPSIHPSISIPAG